MDKRKQQTPGQGPTPEDSSPSISKVCWRQWVAFPSWQKSIWSSDRMMDTDCIGVCMCTCMCVYHGPSTWPPPLSVAAGRTWEGSFCSLTALSVKPERSGTESWRAGEMVADRKCWKATQSDSRSASATSRPVIIDAINTPQQAHVKLWPLVKVSLIAAV